MGKALSVLGAVISLASLVVGIWLQFEITIFGHPPAHLEAQERLAIALQMLTPLAVGLLLVAVGRVLILLEARPPTAN